MTKTRVQCHKLSPTMLLVILMLGTVGMQPSCAPTAGMPPAPQNIPRTHSNGNPLARCNSKRSRNIVKLTNAARKDAGLKPVFCAPELAKVALGHANDMCAHAYFSHNSRDGRTMQDRVEKAGIQYRAIGENIAMGQRSPQEVHTGWMGSPVHRDNILRPVFSRLGIGYASCNGKPVWVQNFAN